MTVTKRLARNTDFVHKHVCCRTEGEPVMIQREKKSREAESQACGILVWPHTCQEVSSLVETVPDSKCELILEMSRAPFTDDLCMCRRPSRRHLGRAHRRRGGCQEAPHIKLLTGGCAYYKSLLLCGGNNPRLGVGRLDLSLIRDTQTYLCYYVIIFSSVK